MRRRPLPIDDVLPKLLAALESHATVLLSAPPGAGKTTRVPPALLAAPWREGRKILMLEPRRLAARAAARFMARELNEPAGKTIGYRTRLDTKVSADARIEVVTEGILTRLIQSDPALTDYAAILFDEFHERSLHADLGLALARESQQALRPELRILIMSATLQSQALAQLLDHAPTIAATGRSHPVDTHYRPCPRERGLSAHTAVTIKRALAEESGSVLVFLPGIGEIRQVAKHLGEDLPDDVRLCPLFGHLDPAEQDAAIAPAPAGTRKIVLATSIAESSLTIEGVRVVVDAGLQRRSQFDPNSGMSRLVTERVSKSSADQRRGRAGRLEPGICYRLWSESEQSQLRPQTVPEILTADLAPLVLELALWGVHDPDELTWLDPPPRPHWQQAVDLLKLLDALDQTDRITAAGRDMLALGLHPRLAHMVIRARTLGQEPLAAELAALLSERDLLGPESGSDLMLRIRALHGQQANVPRARVAQARKLARQIAGRGSGKHYDPEYGGRLLALAFPDRIAKARQGTRGRYVLANGRGAFLPEDDPLAGEAWLAVAELDGKARESRIFRAAAVDQADLEHELARHISAVETADWDDSRGTLIARRQRRLGALVIDEVELDQPSAAAIEAGLLSVVRRKGLDSLPWTDPARQWLARVRLLHRQWPEQWPNLSEAHLLETLEDWLGPFLAGRKRWSDIETMDLAGALNALLDHTQQEALARLAPTHMEIPTGRRVRIDYTAAGGPVLATKLQSVFGWTQSPRIAGGEIPVVLHLLSPASRPLAVTADLGSFWKNAYQQVRKDMRGRYPKHPWPENPMDAPAQESTRHRQA